MYELINLTANLENYHAKHQLSSVTFCKKSCKAFCILGKNLSVFFFGEFLKYFKKNSPHSWNSVKRVIGDKFQISKNIVKNCFYLYIVNYSRSWCFICQTNECVDYLEITWLKGYCYLSTFMENISNQSCSSNCGTPCRWDGLGHAGKCPSEGNFWSVNIDQGQVGMPQMPLLGHGNDKETPNWAYRD